MKEIRCKQCSRQLNGIVSSWSAWELRAVQFEESHSPYEDTFKTLMLDGGTFCGPRCMATYLLAVAGPEEQ